jgi:prepilin-type N-terminal cleavage/methylation domain-containing protein
MTPNRSARPPGFTLVEVMVALVVLAIGAAGIIQLLGQSQQQNTRRRASETSQRIADAEVEAARAGGVWNVPSPGTATRLADDGTPDPTGPYRVFVERQVLCDAASARPADDGVAASGCAGALAQVAVTVEHLDAGTWTTRASRVIVDAGARPATGRWSPAGTP